MSKEELLAEILRLSVDEQRDLIAEAMDHLSELSVDPDMTPELREELERRDQDATEHPGDEMNWKAACAELDRRKAARSQSASQ